MIDATRDITDVVVDAEAVRSLVPPCSLGTGGRRPGLIGDSLLGDGLIGGARLGADGVLGAADLVVRFVLTEVTDGGLDGERERVALGVAVGVDGEGLVPSRMVVSDFTTLREEGEGLVAPIRAVG